VTLPFDISQLPTAGESLAAAGATRLPNTQTNAADFSQFTFIASSLHPGLFLSQLALTDNCRAHPFAVEAGNTIGVPGMSNVTALKQTNRSDDANQWQMRVDLAAAFRLCVLNDWHEGVANHLSLAVSPDGSKFLMNPRWMHFSRIRASDLLLLDASDRATMQRPDAPDLTAWSLHGRLHANLPQARCIIHLHPAYGTAVASLANPDIPPIDQNTARFYNRLAFDRDYGGMANTDDEGDRLARLMGNKQIMMLGNHGVLVCAESVAEAYDLTYYLERACRNLALATSMGQPLHVMSPAVAEKTAREWEADREQFKSHFAEMKHILDMRDPSYAD
jgi:ribulose-5-phosphate 4-epimerase/fuculose-1-phosphate aldolase